jgi:molybdopterin molybdotransferase
MIDADEALRMVMEAVEPSPPRKIRLAEACGARLVEPILADRDYPPFARAMMDGYAVCAADAGQSVWVVGEIPAGRVEEGRVTRGRCFAIMTGAPCPPGTEAVVQREQVRRSGDRVTLPPRIVAGQNIAPRGSECRAGRAVVEAGQTITPLVVAVIASFGVESVWVSGRPSLAVITTGAELAEPGQQPGPGQIRDSNGPMLAALARQAGIEHTPHLHAADELEEIRGALETVADRNLILLSGGVSAGDYDLVPQAVAGYGAEIVFHRVKQKPGKPLLFARKGRQLLFGLPGNPLAAHLCFVRYVAPAIRRMEGKSAEPQTCVGRLTAPVEYQGGRTFFLLARAEPDAAAPDGWRVEPLRGISSADLFTPCRANCYLRVPAGHTRIAEGDRVEFQWT